MASACTSNNTCFVLGSSSGTGTGATSAQVSKGTSWASLDLPHANSPTFQGSSCWNDGCIIFGSSIDGDLLWRFSSTSASVVALASPTISSAVEAVSCFAPNSCAVIDMGGKDSAAQFFLTTDAGVTWTSRVATPFDATSLSCTSSKRCVAASANSTWSTSNSGQTWFQSTPLTGTLTNLSCSLSNCVAKDTGTTHSHLWRSSDFGKTWTASLIAGQTFAFACLNTEHCVSAGQNKVGTGMVTAITGSSFSPLPVSYFPNPITTLACGSSRCVAGGLYSVALFKP
jgi:hypothetical protein